MKKILFALFVIAMVQNSCKKQESNKLSPTQDHDSVEVSSFKWPIGNTQYSYDAWRMAYEYDTLIKSPYKDSLSIEKALADTISNALAAIYNSHFPQRDTIVNVYQIHNYCDLILRDIAIAVNDISHGWVAKCWNNQYPTGFALLDSFHNRFGLSTENVYMYPWDSVIALQVPLPLNCLKLCQMLTNRPQIKYAELNYCAGGDGDYIRFYRENDYYKIIFDHGYDDCPSGCISHEFWQFNVYKDAKVRFVKKW